MQQSGNTRTQDIDAADNVLNMKKIDAFRNYDPEGGMCMAKRVIATYLETAPQYMSQIERAVLAQNSQELFQAAHTLKSSAAHIGAETLSDMWPTIGKFRAQ